MTDIETELANFVASYEARWRAMDWEGLGRHWAQDDPALYYLAEEMEQPFHSWEDVARYWRFNGRLIRRMAMRTTRHRFRRLSDDIASLIYAMAWGAELEAPSGMESKPVAGEVWVMALARRTDDGWRYFHYVEAPHASLPFLVGVHERQAAAAVERFS